MRTQPSRRALEARVPFVLAAATLALASAGAAAQGYTFKTIDLDPQQGTVLLDATRSGATLGYELPTAGSNICMLLQGKLRTVIADPQGTGTTCGGIDKAGTIVGYYEADGNVATGYTLVNGSYADFAPPVGISGLLPISINDAGTIAGYYYDSENGAHGFTLAGAAFTTFQVPGATNVFPVGLNDAGLMTLQVFDADGLHAYLRHAGKLREIMYPGAVETIVERVNNHDQVVGAWIDAGGAEHGYIYDAVAARWTSIDVPGAVLTALDGIDDAGVLVGSYVATPGGLRQGLRAVPIN